MLRNKRVCPVQLRPGHSNRSFYSLLLEAGVRRICVCLADSFPNNAAERAIKAVIEDQYPDHIIGAVPVLLGSEMVPLRHDLLTRIDIWSRPWTQRISSWADGTLQCRWADEHEAT